MYIVPGIIAIFKFNNNNNNKCTTIEQVDVDNMYIIDTYIDSYIRFFSIENRNQYIITAIVTFSLSFSLFYYYIRLLLFLLHMTSIIPKTDRLLSADEIVSKYGIIKSHSSQKAHSLLKIPYLPLETRMALI